MKTYYSLLFASLRKVTQEKISIGLIVFDGSIALCRFSHNKINGLKHIMSKDDFKVISEAVDVLEKKMRQLHDVTLNYNNQLFKINDPEFSVDYINYLSRYKNNLVTYTTPRLIDIDVTEANALKLFENMVGAEDTQVAAVKKTGHIDRLNETYPHRLSSHFISNHTVTMHDIPNLLVPVKVDLVGKNGMDVFVQSIDMTAAQPQIIQEISTFYILKETYKRSNLPIKDFVLSEEPPRDLKKQHALWKQLKDSNEFNYVDISEGGKIIEYAEEHNVKPVFGDMDETEGHPF